MDDNVVKFYPMNAAENPDYVLEQALGAYKEVFIIGTNEEGHMEIRGTLGLTKARMIFLMESFKFNLLAGVYDEED